MHFTRIGRSKLGVGHTDRGSLWGWRALVLGGLAVCLLLAFSHQAATPVRAAGEGIFSLDKAEYETLEGQAVLVTVTRTQGGILTAPIEVQLALGIGTHTGSGTGFDWPPSDEVKLLTFPAGSNLTQQQVFIQTLNQNQYSSRSISVTIRSVSNGGQLGAIWTAPIHLDGTNQPQILSISPKAGDWWSVDGTVITVTGRNFDTPLTRVNAVRFVNIPGTNTQTAGAAAIFDVSPTSFRVRVPDGLTDYADPLVFDKLLATFHLIVEVYEKPGLATFEGESRPTPADLFVVTSGSTVTSVTPDEGPAAGGTVVNITGTKFGGVAGTPCAANTVVFRDAVTLSTLNASTCQFTGTNTIVVTTPQRSSGLTHVIVTIAGKSSPPTVDSEYRYDQGPIVTSISPAFGPLTGGTLVEILGTNFAGVDVVPGSSVFFGGTAATSFTVHSDTRITAVSPQSSGIQQITVTHGQSGASPFTTNANFTYSTGPLINSISPTFGPVTGGTVVTITGTGFLPGSTVRFGTVQATFATVVSETRIDVTSPPGTGNQMIRVTANGVTSPDTPLASFAYSGPVITSISPIAGPIAGGTLVTIKGQNFTSLSTVQFGVLNATPTFVDTQTLTVTSPANAVGEAVFVRVTTGSGQSPEVPASLFTYTNGPIIDSLNPAAGPTTGGSIVIITGKNFTSPLTVAFGSTPAPSFNINSATQITVLSPSHSTAEAVDVRVTKGADVSPVGVATKFTYSSAVPIIASLTPNQGSTFGGYDVVIVGLGFTGATCPGAVKFGAMPAATCTVINDNTLSVKAPPNVSGATVVSITTANGTSAIAENFTYVSPSGPGGGTSPPAPSPVGTEINVLTFRWTLMTWGGLNNTPIENALRGIGTPGGVDISHRVTAIFEWDVTNQVWKAYFPGAAGVPGAADFTVFAMGSVYWVAINGEGTLNWVIPAEQ